MRALSINGPWWQAILYGDKRVENRSWRHSYRGTLAIHASKRVDTDPVAHEICGPTLPVSGCIVGTVELVDIVSDTELVQRLPAQEQWAFGPWCWIFENPRPLECAIPMRGRIGVFAVPRDVQRAMRFRADLPS